MKADHFSADIQDLLFLLAKYDARYVIVGGEAVIYHGHARLTGDVDIFYESLPENAKRIFAVLAEFWENSIPGLNHSDELLEPGLILQFGVPPNRLDLINRIESVSFKDAWDGKASEEITLKGQRINIYFLGLDQLIRNKEALDRPKDLEDLKYLKEVKKGESGL